MNSKALVGIIIAVVIIAGGLIWFSVAHHGGYDAQSAGANGGQQSPMIPYNPDGGNSQMNGSTTGMMASSTRRYNGAMANVPKGGFASGTITAVGTESITIQMRDNTSKTVDFDSSTVFKKYDTGSASMIAASIDDMTVGERIIAIGTPNTDGSVQATMINEGMPMRQRTAGGTNGGASAQTPPTSTQ